MKRTKRWFDVVRADLSQLPKALAHYNEAIDEASQHMVAIGHLETLCAETPGLLGYYKAYHTDAQQIRKWLENERDVLVGKKYIYFISDPEAKSKFGALKTTDVKNFVKADNAVADIEDTIRVVDNAESHFDTICVALTNRSIMLNTIKDIRKEGLQDVWVNPTKETRNI